MVEKSCVICGGSESEGDILLPAPCRTHYVCVDDVASFFQRATESESLFPPKCCEQMFILDEYEEHVPFDVAWQYRVKEQGEFRVFCGNPKCTKFLHPSSHIIDDTTGITYTICEDEACGKITCIGCRTLLRHGVANHVCKKDEDEEKFKQEVFAKGYQLCSTCNTTIELIEACNHVTCECGHDFCYVCGKDWTGLHACPHYGPPTYDEDGFNQDGYHRDTGLNRDGLTRRQDLARRRGQNEEDLDENDDEFADEGDPDWEVLQHLTQDQRAALDALIDDARDDALDQLRIELFETRGLTFGGDARDEEEDEDEGENDDDAENEDQDGDEEDHPDQVAQNLTDLLALLQPLLANPLDLQIGHPFFPQAVQNQLANYPPQRILELLRVIDPAYNPSTHTLVIDFDRVRIEDVAIQLVDRGGGGQFSSLDEIERLLLAVLPHAIARSRGAELEVDDDHDELYAAPDRTVPGGSVEAMQDAPPAGPSNEGGDGVQTVPGGWLDELD